jgi:DNA-binding MarR family transcriptional regulator
MTSERRRFPPGVEPQEAISLREFLPYRLHHLSSKVAMPPPFELPDGRIIRAREWRVILQLAARGPLTNSELAELVGMDAATVTRVVQQLALLELVTAKVSSSDRRRQIVSLTPAGAEAHDLIAPGRREAAEAMIGCLDAPERERLFELLDRLEAHLTGLRTTPDDPDWES